VGRKQGENWGNGEKHGKMGKWGRNRQKAEGKQEKTWGKLWEKCGGNRLGMGGSEIVEIEQTQEKNGRNRKRGK